MNKKLTRNEELEEIEKIKKFLQLSVIMDISSIPLVYLVFFNPSTLQTYFVFGFSIAVQIGSLVYAFVKDASASAGGIKLHLQIEKHFITTELPNIIQFVTILGLASFYLKDVRTRAVLALLVAMLLSIYLKAKRQDLLAQSAPKMQSKISIPATARLHGLVSIFVGSLVFACAELLAKP
jgi:hypothetical protein